MTLALDTRGLADEKVLSTDSERTLEQQAGPWSCRRGQSRSAGAVVCSALARRTRRRVSPVLGGAPLWRPTLQHIAARDKESDTRSGPATARERQNNNGGTDAVLTTLPQPRVLLRPGHSPSFQTHSCPGSTQRQSTAQSQNVTEGLQVEAREEGTACTRRLHPGQGCPPS